MRSWWRAQPQRPRAKAQRESSGFLVRGESSGDPQPVVRPPYLETHPEVVRQTVHYPFGTYLGQLYGCEGASGRAAGKGRPAAAGRREALGALFPPSPSRTARRGVHRFREEDRSPPCDTIDPTRAHAVVRAER